MRRLIVVSLAIAAAIVPLGGVPAQQSTDDQFLREAVMDGITELTLARDAATRATSDEVRTASRRPRH